MKSCVLLHLSEVQALSLTDLFTCRWHSEGVASAYSQQTASAPAYSRCETAAADHDASQVSCAPVECTVVAVHASELILYVTCGRSLGSSGAGEAPQVGRIDVAAVQQLLHAGNDAAVQLIDVREEDEHATASLPGFQLLPLSRHAPWEALRHES